MLNLNNYSPIIGKCSMNLHCEIHGEFAGQKFWIEALSKAIYSRCPQCQEEERQKNRERDQEVSTRIKQKTVADLLENSRIPALFQSRSFDNYQASSVVQERVLGIAKRYAEKFPDRLANGGGLIFLGNSGTGKTHLAVAIAKHVVQLCHAVFFTTAVDALRSVKDSFRLDAKQSVQQSINYLLKPDLLIIDEVGVQYGSKAEKVIFFEIINHRYHAMKPTILISNLSESEFIRCIDVRCFDRLQQGGGFTLRFTWGSYRKQVRYDSASQ